MFRAGACVCVCGGALAGLDPKRRDSTRLCFHSFVYCRFSLVFSLPPLDACLIPLSCTGGPPEGPPGVPSQHGLLRMVHVSLVVSSSLSTPKPRQQHPVYANHVCLGNRNGRRAWLWQAGRAVTQREEVNTGCL